MRSFIICVLILILLVIKENKCVGKRDVHGVDLYRCEGNIKMGHRYLGHEYVN
jgi:hypothetical protein